MWFDRARFGHLDDDAFNALHHYQQKPADTQAKQVDADKQPAQSVKQEKAGQDAVLKLSDFTHLLKSKNQATTPPSFKPIEHPHDGRWVLAVRTAESLRHGQLDPDKRVRLMKLGKLLGLTPMDANRIICVIVEHAEQGIAPEQLTRQSFAQLQEAAPPPMRSVSRVNWFTVAITSVLLLLLEFVTLFSIFRK
jgi:hypothetical protein